MKVARTSGTQVTATYQLPLARGMLTSYFSDNDGDAVLGEDHFFVTDSRSSVAGLQLSTGSIDVNWQAAACTTSPCPEISLAGVAPGDKVIANQTGNSDASSTLFSLTPGTGTCAPSTFCVTSAPPVPNATLTAFDFSGSYNPFVNGNVVFTGDNYFCLCLVVPADPAAPPLTVGGSVTPPDTTNVPDPEPAPPWPEEAMDGSREASKFDFELVWCENGSCSDLTDTNKNIAFNVRADDPPHGVLTLSAAQVSVIKSQALSALQAAFNQYNVNVGVGGRGSNTVYVTGDLKFDACAETTGNNTAVSRVYYPDNMSQAQYALNMTNGGVTDTLLKAIGEGIGNNAAHEIAHQLKNLFSRFGKVVGNMGLDDDSVDTYNGASCDGSKDPWVYTGVGTDADKTPIHWEMGNADVSLRNILGNKVP